jgi:magnesium and cobalt transporter
VSGLVTVEDLLEEIVGEIADEHEDEREPVSRIADGVFSVSGKANIGIVRDLFGRGPEEEEFTTIGGFLASRLGHIPRPGETFAESDLRFTVEEADRRRVYRVRIEPVASFQPSALSPQPETVASARLKADS